MLLSQSRPKITKEIRVREEERYTVLPTEAKNVMAPPISPTT